jgi:transposase InsO family protein
MDPTTLQARFGLTPAEARLALQLATGASLWTAAAQSNIRYETTPIESPQSNGMAEAFVRTIKRDYVRVSPCPDADTVMHQLSAWINHYNEVHPHKATRITP